MLAELMDQYKHTAVSTPRQTDGGTPLRQDSREEIFSVANRASLPQDRATMLGPGARVALLRGVPISAQPYAHASKASKDAHDPPGPGRTCPEGPASPNVTPYTQGPQSLKASMLALSSSQHRGLALDELAQNGTRLEAPMAQDGQDSVRATHLKTPKWIQGMRRQISVSSTRMSWQELLFHRLESNHHKIPIGENTRKAEDGLRLEHSSYYFLGRCEPFFGESAIAFDSPSNSAAVTPFDSGGLWFDHHPLKTHLSNREKLKLIERVQMDCSIYAIHFCSWMAEAYTSFQLYVDGERPERSYVPEINVNAPDAEPRSWTWEGRVPHVTPEPLTTKPVTIFLQRDKLVEYTNWIQSYNNVPSHVRIQHLKMLGRIYKDPNKILPGEAMNLFIKGTSTC